MDSSDGSSPPRGTSGGSKAGTSPRSRAQRSDLDPDQGGGTSARPSASPSIDEHRPGRLGERDAALPAPATDRGGAGYNELATGDTGVAAVGDPAGAAVDSQLVKFPGPQQCGAHIRHPTVPERVLWTGVLAPEDARASVGSPSSGRCPDERKAVRHEAAGRAGVGPKQDEPTSQRASGIMATDSNWSGDETIPSSQELSDTF